MRSFIALTTFAVLLCGRLPAHAQDYPSRPIRVIAVTSAGGTSDIFMRALADEMHKGLGQPIVIENRPGGAFNIGARACAEAPPDGYTICILPGEPLVFNQFLFKSLAYDPAKRFEPITQLFSIMQALVVSAALNVKTHRRTRRAVEGEARHAELFAPARCRSACSSTHQPGTGADMVRVPFRGGGEAVNALLTGATPVGFHGLANVRAPDGGGPRDRPHGGQRKALAAVPRHSDHSRGDRQGLSRRAPISDCSRRPARRSRSRRASGRDRAHRGAAGFPQAAISSSAGSSRWPARPRRSARFIREDRALAAQIVKEAGLEPQ